MLIVDGHLDIAYNALLDGRSLLESALHIRRDEARRNYRSPNGRCMVGLPELLAGQVCLVNGTVMAIPEEHVLPGERGYVTEQEASEIGNQQIDVYDRWTDTSRQIHMVRIIEDLDFVLNSWECGASRVVGIVLLIENADVIERPEDVGDWYQLGVRLVGPAWRSNRYTGSSMDDGPLTDSGRELLRYMAEKAMALDISHMSDDATSEALSMYDGIVVASHANPRKMVDMQRHLSDRTIRGIAEHQGVTGIMPVNWALYPDSAQRDRRNTNLDRVVNAVEIVCELTGSAAHVAIGSDFDGGQGAEAVPMGIDTVADLSMIAECLDSRGYTSSDVEAIMSGNWIRIYRNILAGPS